MSVADVLLILLAGLGLGMLWVCAIERRWDVFWFALIMFGGTGVLLIYGAGHSLWGLT